MPTVKPPTTPYAEAAWKAKPFGGEADDSEKFEYEDDDTLATVASKVSKPWRMIGATELARYNWGSAITVQINHYLKEYNGCTTADSSDSTYVLSKTNDTKEKWLWVPDIEKLAYYGKYKHPAQQDVGHVALDDQKDKHINTLVIPPVYSIALELGDVDALFDPVMNDDAFKPSGGRKADSKKFAGLRKRLQALGYLYTPLGHSKCCDHAKKIWEEYYRKRVHKTKGSGGAVPTETEAFEVLRTEVRSNILGVPSGDDLPESGEMLQSRLPAPGEFGMIRMPGGYGTTYPHADDRRKEGTRWKQVGGSWVPDSLGADGKYDFMLDAPRWMVEDAVWEDNDLMGKIPLVARVKRILPDGTEEEAEGVAVYFQLVVPDELPDASPLKAPDLRDHVMNYDYDWQKAELVVVPPPPEVPIDMFFSGPSIDEMTADQAVAKSTALHALRMGEKDPPKSAAEVQTYIDGRIAGTQEHRRTLTEQYVTELMDYARPERAKKDRTKGKGPKKLVDAVFKDQTDNKKCTDEDEDPQNDNADKEYGGKRRVPVEGKGKPGATGFVPGVFEVGVARSGLHSKRTGTGYADYGDLGKAKKVEPVKEKDETGTEVELHKHSVRAFTNEKGCAGVVFTPSRIGGDRYKLRAYIGAPTLGFDGTDENGPVANTGTLVVWRNIRLHRYVQANVSTNVANLAANVAHTFAQIDTTLAWVDHVWGRANVDTPVGDVDISASGNGTASYDRNPKFWDRNPDANPDGNYRPHDHEFIGPAEQFNRCYCEFLVDCPRAPEQVKRGEYEAAVAKGRTAAKDSGEVGKVLDWAKLIMKPDADGGNADRITSPWFINLRHRSDYNHVAANAKRLSGHRVAEVRTAIYNHCFHAMLAHFGGGGFYPGYTIVQFPRAETFEHMGDMGGSIISSGDMGSGARTAGLYYTEAVYRSGMCYSTTSNAMHELGHSLVRPHAAGNHAAPGGAMAECHQPPADSICLMSYDGCYGEFCGQCSLALRGFKTQGGTVQTDGSMNTEGTLASL